MRHELVLLAMELGGFKMGRASQARWTDFVSMLKCIDTNSYTMAIAKAQVIRSLRKTTLWYFRPSSVLLLLPVEVCIPDEAKARMIGRPTGPFRWRLGWQNAPADGRITGVVPVFSPLHHPVPFIHFEVAAIRQYGVLLCQAASSHPQWQ